DDDYRSGRDDVPHRRQQRSSRSDRCADNRLVRLAIVALVLAAAGAHARCVDIPFRWTPGQIEISVAVNGRAPVWFILDSGAESSIVGSDLARELRLSRAPHSARGFAHNVDLDLGGGLTLPNQDVMVMPLANFKAQHRDIQGLIGYDFFARYAVVVDYAKRIVS